MTDTDFVRRFVLEQQAVRGQLVRLGPAWTALREHTDYPPAVRDLLGEAIAATVLLAATLKFEGTLTLQLQGNGAVRMLVAQCTQDFQLRAVARFDAERVAEAAATAAVAAPATVVPFAALAGEGYISVTIEANNSMAPYQGIVSISGESLAACLDGYFANSEQLPTRVRLAANTLAAGGVLLQRLSQADSGLESDAPSAAARDTQALAAWQEAVVALDSIAADELLLRDSAAVMQRCAAGFDVRVFASQPVRFQCRCAPQRVANMLRSLGESEVRDVLRAEGAVTVTCEFCQRPYRFDAIDVEQLFINAAASGVDTVN